MFEKRRAPMTNRKSLCRILRTEDSHIGTARTDRTFNWPVYVDYEAAFRDLAALYEVRPMRVWDPDNHPVPPVEVKDAVHGALVEVLFWMKHCARQKDGQCHNIFTGT